MKPGVYPALSNADYHGGPGTSKSGLDIINRSALHFHHANTAANDNDRKPTPAQAFGAAFHAISLEPHLFVQEYCLGLRRQDVPEAIDERDVLVSRVEALNLGRLPKLSTSGSKAELIERIKVAEAVEIPEALRHTDADLEAMKGAELKTTIDMLNVGRQGLLSTSGSRHDLANILRANGQDITLWGDVQAEWMQNNGHRQVVNEEDWQHLHGMRDALMADPDASHWLTQPGKAEESYYWACPRTGLLLRCRPDYRTDTGVIVDLKSTDDASEEAFAQSIAKWRYHVQDPFYIDGTNHALDQSGDDRQRTRAFVFVVVEKKPPYAVAVYRLDAESREIGRIEYQRNVDTLSECISTETWPGYNKGKRGIRSISLAGWRKAAFAQTI